MRNRLIVVCIIVSFLALGVFVGRRTAAAQERNLPEAGATNIIPLIVIENVPLHDAIRNLARQSGINYVLDPHILGPVTTSDRRFVPEPTVSCRWSELSASAALNRVLKANKLKL